MHRRAWGFVALCFAMAAVYAGEVYRGNTQTRVFHQTSCRYYTCKNCTATFASAADAVDHGYRPCGVCEPAGGGRTEAVTAAFTGNTGSRKFHRASCRYASCKNCTAKFDTRREAIDAGYVPGGCCDP
jgi:metal binding Ada-like protein